MRRPAPPGVQESPFLFRRMVEDDLDRVMEIELQAFSHPWSAELFRRELTHPWSTVLLATEPRPAPEGRREQLLGFVIYWLVHDELHVLNVAVAGEERRRGVARALLEEMSARGRLAGAVLATLEVRRSNRPAIALYESLGYRRVGLRPNYYVDEGEDAIVMNADL
ncbi:ribosomal protein S18-alanine N-acetyltransferase [Anaeromyxobacter paludicola]|uniref:Ribosomal-protein-alanine acetyltransferase n=1 Tax=Anaeromyxobacter paludicola TaxID=2918171 RepID=A0ABN6N7C4_9BACT|nr:ribosomal protein S18-alanine N-acetyltransferase [Anaeromyxobacter paludicola]BDG08058.1 ribosomal-protein-alanine acetyltransferase [Anaeromyxobacter paludicola]